MTEHEKTERREKAFCLWARKEEFIRQIVRLVAEYPMLDSQNNPLTTQDVISALEDVINTLKSNALKTNPEANYHLGWPSDLLPLRDANHHT